jgi:predicted aspartyl protease
VKFPYAAREVDPLPGETGVQLIHEPIILVRFTGPSRSYLIRGLLDTGASMTLVPRSYMTRLGITPIGTGRLSTAAGGLSVQVGSVELEVKAGRTSLHWSARVGFVPRVDNLALLGHAGFLDHFSAVFDGLRREVRLTPNGTAPRPSVTTA